MLLLDGVHLLEEALTANMAVEIIAVDEMRMQGAAGVAVARAAARGARTIAVSEEILGAISPVRQPSGVVALAARAAVGLAQALEQPPQLILVLADVQDPGNVGASVRVAEACGATGVVTTPGTADPYGWKALRGSMGSAFRMPIAVRQPLDQAVRSAQSRGITVYAAVPHGARPLAECDLCGPSAILLGGEGAGLSPEIRDLADYSLTIPMRAPVESLNVAIAAALVVYEAMRQRSSP